MRLALGLVFTLSVCPFAWAQPPAPGGATTGAVRPTRTTQPPVIDGRLNDPVWSTATRITRFVEMTPVEGAAASENTEAWVAYDSEQIYFGFYAHYSDPSLVRANRVERDQISQDDAITIYFDTTGDQQRAYAFSVNGYGVQGDSLIVGVPGANATTLGLPSGNDTWDTLFTSAGGLVADGWTAEVAIPFKSLRYPAKDADETHRWGFQIARSITSKDETVVAFPVTRNIAGFVSQLGVIDGITGPLDEPEPGGPPHLHGDRVARARHQRLAASRTPTRTRAPST